MSVPSQVYVRMAHDVGIGISLGLRLALKSSEQFAWHIYVVVVDMIDPISLESIHLLQEEIEVLTQCIVDSMPVLSSNGTALETKANVVALCCPIVEELRIAYRH